MTWDHPLPGAGVYRYYPVPSASVRETSGPVRVETDPDPEFRRRPIGFAPSPRHRADRGVDHPPRVYGDVPRPGRHRSDR